MVAAIDGGMSCRAERLARFGERGKRDPLAATGRSARHAGSQAAGRRPSCGQDRCAPQPSSWMRSRRRTTSRWSSCKRCSPVGIGTLWRFFDRQDHAQKKTAHATEQDRPDIVKRREEWFDGQLDLDPERLVFIDETWASTNMARRHGRCRRGERLRSGVPHGHWKTTTLVAGLRRTGMVAPMVLDAARSTGMRSLPKFARCWCPPLTRDIVIMDNLSSHKAPAARDAIEAAGAKLLIPSALQSRLQPDRAGILQAQGTPAKGRRAHYPRPVGRHRPHPRPVLATGVCQLLRQRRIRCRLIGIRSSWYCPTRLSNLSTLTFLNIRNIIELIFCSRSVSATWKMRLSAI